MNTNTLHPAFYITALIEALKQIAPNATVGDDNDGQIIIYTNLKLVGDKLEDMGE